jgi:hypothetical protein
MSMDDLDPRAHRYKKSHRDRRKKDDPSYKGPERRLGKKRQKELDEIMTWLIEESGSEK